MSSHHIIIEGTVQADGTLTLDKPTNLPAGRVQVIVQPLPSLPHGDRFWDMMEAIWEGQEARGFVPRSAEHVEAERCETRENWEERLQGIERLREESRRLREQQP